VRAAVGASTGAPPALPCLSKDRSNYFVFGGKIAFNLHTFLIGELSPRASVMDKYFVRASGTDEEHELQQASRKRPRNTASSAGGAAGAAGAAADTVCPSELYASILSGSSLDAGAIASSIDAAAEPVEGEQPGFMCLVCEATVTSASRAEHESSTLHIFNMKLASSARRVHLDESNKGFHLLTRMGWNIDEGLGPDNRGAVDPIRTIFKTDNSGLGVEKLQPRVTHFASHSTAEAQRASDGKSKAVREQEALSKRSKSSNSSSTQIFSSSSSSSSNYGSNRAGVNVFSTLQQAGAVRSHGVQHLSLAQRKVLDEKSKRKERALRWELSGQSVPEGYEAFFAKGKF
jgi:G-patch domain